MRSLFIGIYSLYLTIDLDLNNDLVKRCVAYLFIIVQCLIEKYAFILFLRIFTCLEGHKYGCRDLDLWDMHMKHQSANYPCCTSYSYRFWGRSNHSWFFYEFLMDFWTSNMAAMTLTFEISKRHPFRCQPRSHLVFMPSFRKIWGF
jgi:hypothetical protein